jgi:glycosyltransferase involved in cell wall biosynthesis
MTGLSTEGGAAIDVVICTYNNAGLLDGALAAIGRQVVPDNVEWRVLVVDNNSTDDTADVVERHQRLGLIPGLTRVFEPVQGLTQARLRGVRSTDAPWVAFVDDDCRLQQDWVARTAAFAVAHPDSGAFGGRVVLQWESPPPAFVTQLGWAFAEQDHGPEPAPTDCLVGTGMVVNRAALDACGWTRGPLLDDRVGKKLVSGGDVELALRIRSVRPLWYVPDCVLRHVISPRRTSFRYLAALTRGLGVSKTYGDSMPWPGSFGSWSWSTSRSTLGATAGLARQAAKAVAGRMSFEAMLVDASFVQGRWLGLVRMLRGRATGRLPFFGCAQVP